MPGKTWNSESSFNRHVDAHLLGKATPTFSTDKDFWDKWMLQRSRILCTGCQKTVSSRLKMHGNCKRALRGDLVFEPIKTNLTTSNEGWSLSVTTASDSVIFQKQYHYDGPDGETRTSEEAITDFNVFNNALCVPHNKCWSLPVGDTMVMLLNQRMSMCFSAESLSKLRKYTWVASNSPGKWYVYAAAVDADGKKGLISCARYLLGAKPGDIVDHINGDTLDNRLPNLRITTVKGNCQNRQVTTNSPTGVNGVQPFYRGERLLGFRAMCAVSNKTHAKSFSLADYSDIYATFEAAKRERYRMEDEFELDSPRRLLGPAFLELHRPLEHLLYRPKKVNPLLPFIDYGPIEKEIYKPRTQSSSSESRLRNKRIRSETEDDSQPKTKKQKLEEIVQA